MSEDQYEKYKIDIKDYKIVNIISKTKHGMIYLLENKTTGKQYAAKTNLNKVKILTDSEKRFIWGELGFLLRVQHPIFLKFRRFSFEDIENNKNMAMLIDYIKKGSLSSIIDDMQNEKIDKNFDNTKRHIILLEYVVE